MWSPKLVLSINYTDLFQIINVGHPIIIRTSCILLAIRMEKPTQAKPVENKGSQVQTKEVVVGLLSREIRNQISPKQFEQAQLCLQCLKLDGEELDSAREVLDLYNILSSKLLPSGQKCSAVAITKVILLAVGVGEAEKLTVDRKELETAENLLTFPKLLLKICSRLDGENYHTFQVCICRAELDCNPERISSRVNLMKKLLHKTKISQTNVDILIKWLKSVDRVDLAEEVKRYKDKVTQETNPESSDQKSATSFLVSQESTPLSQDLSSQAQKLVISTGEW